MRISRRQLEAITGKPSAAPAAVKAAAVPALAPIIQPPLSVVKDPRHGDMLARVAKLEAELIAVLAKPAAMLFTVERGMDGRVIGMKAREV